VPAADRAHGFALGQDAWNPRLCECESCGKTPAPPRKSWPGSNDEPLSTGVELAIPSVFFASARPNCAAVADRHICAVLQSAIPK
jgi:hypothetical protein